MPVFFRTVQQAAKALPNNWRPRVRVSRVRDLQLQIVLCKYAACKILAACKAQVLELRQISKALSCTLALSISGLCSALFLTFDLQAGLAGGRREVPKCPGNTKSEGDACEERVGLLGQARPGTAMAMTSCFEVCALEDLLGAPRCHEVC